MACCLSRRKATCPMSRFLARYGLIKYDLRAVALDGTVQRYPVTLFHCMSYCCLCVPEPSSQIVELLEGFVCLRGTSRSGRATELTR